MDALWPREEDRSTHRQPCDPEHVVDGLCDVGGVQVIVVRVAVLHVPLFYCREKAVQLAAGNLQWWRKKKNSKQNESSLSL